MTVLPQGTMWTWAICNPRQGAINFGTPCIGVGDRLLCHSAASGVHFHRSVRVVFLPAAGTGCADADCVAAGSDCCRRPLVRVRRRRRYPARPPRIPASLTPVLPPSPPPPLPLLPGRAPRPHRRRLRRAGHQHSRHRRHSRRQSWTLTTTCPN